MIFLDVCYTKLNSLPLGISVPVIEANNDSSDKQSSHSSEDDTSPGVTASAGYADKILGAL